MHAGRKRGGSAGLVVVFEEAGELVLIVETGVEMLADWASVMIAKTIVEPLVVGVIEALLLKRPFLVPIDFGHEGEVGMALAHFLRRSWPKQRGSLSPGALEYVGQDEHGHVATDTVALAGDAIELA